MKLKILDKTKIKSITFKYPNLMNDRSEEEVRETYKNLLLIKNKLQEYRSNVREYEEKLTEVERVWNDILTFTDVEFDTRESEYTINKANYSVTGCGNDIYGKIAYDK